MKINLYSKGSLQSNEDYRKIFSFISGVEELEIVGTKVEGDYVKIVVDVPTQSDMESLAPLKVTDFTKLSYNYKSHAARTALDDFMNHLGALLKPDILYSYESRYYMKSTPEVISAMMGFLSTCTDNTGIEFIKVTEYEIFIKTI